MPAWERSWLWALAQDSSGKGAACSFDQAWSGKCWGAPWGWGWPGLGPGTSATEQFLGPKSLDMTPYPTQIHASSLF